MIPWRFCWNQIRLRKLRTALTVLSIAGGVAAVVAVLQATAATRRQLDVLHASMKPRVAMEVVATDGTPFPESDLPSLESVPGLQAAVPVFRSYVQMLAHDTEVRGVALGVDLNAYHNCLDFKITSGRPAVERGEVCVEASVADRMGLQVGDEVGVRSRLLPRPISKKVVGILTLQGTSVVEETCSIFLPLDEGRKLGRASGKLTSVQIVLQPDAQSEPADISLRQRLPAGLVVTQPASTMELSEPVEILVNVSLNVAAAMSLVAAMFIVVNTFQISIAEQRRQLALLRIVGATTVQVQASVYREALALGMAGTVLGILVGLSGSAVLAKGMSTAFGIEAAQVPWRLDAVLGGLVFGLLVTLASVWYPARTACDTPPLVALRSATAPHRKIREWKWAGFGLGLLALSGVISICRWYGFYPQEMPINEIELIQIASVLFLPILIRPGSAILYSGLKWISPVDSQLGHRQIMDNFGRSALTVTVLFIVTSSSVSIGNNILAVTDDVQNWFDKTVTSDFLLRASRPRVEMSETEAIRDSVEPRLRTIPGITDIDRVTFSLVTVNGVTATMTLREFHRHSGLPLDVREGDPKKIREELLAGDAVLGTVLAHHLGVRPGDQVRVEADGISHAFKIVGLVQEYIAGGLMIVMNRAAAEKVFPITQTHIFSIRCAPDSKASVEAALRALCRDEGLIFQSLQDCEALVQSMVAGVTNRLWLILLLAMVIAGFAIVNTLSMNVIEQTKCLGMLRVVGMSRLQVFRMFLGQALVLGLLALLPGTAMGVFLAYLISILFEGVTEHNIPFTISQDLLVGYVTCGVLLSLLAAVLPALRACRLNPLEAIHEE